MLGGVPGCVRLRLTVSKTLAAGTFTVATFGVSIREDCTLMTPRVFKRSRSVGVSWGTWRSWTNLSTMLVPNFSKSFAGGVGVGIGRDPEDFFLLFLGFWFVSGLASGEGREVGVPIVDSMVCVLFRELKESRECVKIN